MSTIHHALTPGRDFWHAFECFACVAKAVPLTSGVVFDVRVEADLDVALCPLCGAICKLRSCGRWEASPLGYGSRADVDLGLEALRTRGIGDLPAAILARRTAWGLPT